MNVTESQTKSEVVSEATVGDIAVSVARLVKSLAKKNRKLVERLNRIKNCSIGNQRIYRLDAIATTLETDANLIDQSCVDNLASQDEDDIWSSAKRAAEYGQARQCRSDALFIRRLQYDLRDQHTAINDLQSKHVRDIDYVAGKYDPDNWRGPRP